MTKTQNNSYGEKHSHQWHYKIIMVIEAFSNWLRAPSRKSKVLFICYLCFIAFALWGMFFVPANILTQSADARAWVASTAQFFPWIDNALEHYGDRAERFVYVQCISIWLLSIPAITFSLTTTERNLNNSHSLNNEKCIYKISIDGI